MGIKAAAHRAESPNSCFALTGRLFSNLEVSQQLQYDANLGGMFTVTGQSF